MFRRWSLVGFSWRARNGRRLRQRTIHLRRAFLREHVRGCPTLCRIHPFLGYPEKERFYCNFGFVTRRQLRSVKCSAWLMAINRMNAGPLERPSANLAPFYWRFSQRVLCADDRLSISHIPFSQVSPLFCHKGRAWCSTSTGKSTSVLPALFPLRRLIPAPKKA